MSKQTTTARKGHRSVYRLTRPCDSRWKKQRTKYSYDLNGNLLSDGIRYFAYDDENELTSVTVSNAWQCQFVYDGMKRRRIERDFSWSGSSWTQTNQVNYVYDGNVVVQERNANNLPQVTYTRGNDLSGTLQGAGGIGGLLARTDNGLWNIGSASASAYYFYDGNGNVAGLVNTNGYSVAQYSYDPFGNILTMSGLLASANSYRFSTKEWNNNAGIYYYGRRFYDPSLQRWPNHDPIQEAGGLNLYEYVQNNPINYNDPFGLRADYNSLQTQMFLAKAYASATAGPFKGLWNIGANSMGQYDFKNDSNPDHGSTWNVNGKCYDDAAFGNYIAGFEAAAYDSNWGSSQAPIAGAGVIAGGIVYHFGNAVADVGLDTYYGSGYSNLSDEDILDYSGRPDIFSGASAAPGFINSPIAK